ncbi:MAG: YdcF family protein [Christensenellaceae bacterium]|nr:YdcF family protein [Christensenellaceae bacterium]
MVSGGQGPDERVSETFTMRQYLPKRGIPGEQIILEDRSRNTNENTRFSKAIMSQKRRKAFAARSPPAATACRAL